MAGNDIIKQDVSYYDARAGSDVIKQEATFPFNKVSTTLWSHKWHFYKLLLSYFSAIFQ